MQENSSQAFLLLMTPNRRSLLARNVDKGLLMRFHAFLYRLEVARQLQRLATNVAGLGSSGRRKQVWQAALLL